MYPWRTAGCLPMMSVSCWLSVEFSIGFLAPQHVRHAANRMNYCPQVSLWWRHSCDTATDWHHTVAVRCDSHSSQLLLADEWTDCTALSTSRPYYVYLSVLQLASDWLQAKTNFNYTSQRCKRTILQLSETSTANILIAVAAMSTRNDQQTATMSGFS